MNNCAWHNWQSAVTFRGATLGAAGRQHQQPLLHGWLPLIGLLGWGTSRCPVQSVEQQPRQCDSGLMVVLQVEPVAHWQPNTTHKRCACCRLAIDVSTMPNAAIDRTVIVESKFMRQSRIIAPSIEACYRYRQQGLKLLILLRNLCSLARSVAAAATTTDGR